MAMTSYAEKYREPDYKREGYEKRRKIRNFLLLNLGTLIVALGIHFFKYPNHFALGGVSGLSVVLAALIPAATPATAALVINALLLVLAIFLLGKSFTGKTLYASTLLSVLLLVLEKVVPMTQPLTDEGLLELFIAIAMSGAGGAILFNLGASSGGTDIVALLIQKYTSGDMAKALWTADIFITISAFFVFDIKTGLLSATGLVLKGFIVDVLIDRFNRVKWFTVITEKPDEVGSFVTSYLERSCTRMQGVGEYSGEPRWIFFVAVDLQQAKILRDHVKAIDPHAFMMVSTSSEISGRGFRSGF